MPCSFILQPMKSDTSLIRAVSSVPRVSGLHNIIPLCCEVCILTGYIKIRLCVQCVNEPVMFIDMMYYVSAYIIFLLWDE